MEKEIKAVLTNEEQVNGTIYLEPLRGAQGYSSYEIAVRNGYKGTEYEWVDSLSKSNYYRLYKNVYTAKEDIETPTIYLNLPISYKTEIDMLFVFINGLKAFEGIDFTIENNILTLLNPISKNTTVYYAIPRTINVANGDYELLRGPAGKSVIEWNEENDCGDVNEDIKQLENLMPKGIVSGTNIYLNDSADYKILELKIDGNSYQETGENVPSPDYPSEIQTIKGNIGVVVIGNNSFDDKNLVTKDCTYINNNHSLTVTATYSYAFIQQTIKGLISGQTYHYYHTGDNAPWIVVKDLNGTKIAETYASKSISFKAPSDGIVTISIYATTSSTSGTKIFTNLTVATEKDLSYESYQENITYINLQDNEMCESDTLKIENSQVILTKNIGKTILNGTEDWLVIAAEGNYIFSVKIEGMKSGKGSIQYSTHFPHAENDDYMNNEGICSDGNLYLRNSKFTSKEQLNTWLSENPVTVYYQLATPKIISLGKINLPNTFKNISHIFLLTELDTNFEVKYMKDIETLLGGVSNAS